MAFVQAVWFRFWWLLISLVCIQPINVSSKAVDPQTGLVCFAGNSLTRIDNDGTKHIQPVQSWQPKLDHAPCSTHLTCDGSVNGVHVPTSEGIAYAVRGQGAVFVVTQDSTVTSLALTIDLHAKNCNLRKLVNFPHGFFIECMRDGSRDPIRLIPVQYSGGKWAEKELVRVDVDQDKAVNQGVSAMLEVGGLQWYLFAQDNLLCSYDLVRGQRQCSPLAQDKCHHVAEILPIPGHTGVLIACTTGPGSLHITYVALYNTSSAQVEKENYPTGTFRAIHVSSSGDFTVFVGSRFITVVLTLDSSSSAQQKELPVSHGEVVLSLVSREMLLYTTKEAALKGLATYQTNAVDLPKAFHEGAPAERLEGDNCTVTERPGPGEWIAACSDALFWYKGTTSDRVRITWLDGSAMEQQCFASRPQFGPVTESTTPTSATLPVTCSPPASSEAEHWKTVAIVILALAVVVITTLIVAIFVLWHKLHNQQAKSRKVPDVPVQETAHRVPTQEDLEGEVQGSHSLLRRDDAHSTASTISRRHSLPPPNEMTRRSLTSLEGICGSSQPQNNAQTSRVTHTGTLQSLSESSLAASVTNTSTAPPSLENEVGPSNGANFTETGATIAFPQGDAEPSDSTFSLPTHLRATFTCGNGASND